MFNDILKTIFFTFFIVNFTFSLIAYYLGEWKRDEEVKTIMFYRLIKSSIYLIILVNLGEL